MGMVSQQSRVPSNSSRHSLITLSAFAPWFDSESNQSMPAVPAARRNRVGASASPSCVRPQCWARRRCSTRSSQDRRQRSAGSSSFANRCPKQDTDSPWVPPSVCDSSSKAESRDASRASSRSRRVCLSSVDALPVIPPSKLIVESAAKRGWPPFSSPESDRSRASCSVTELSGRSTRSEIVSAVRPAPDRPRAIHSIRSACREDAHARGRHDGGAHAPDVRRRTS